MSDCEELGILKAAAALNESNIHVSLAGNHSQKFLIKTRDELPNGIFVGRGGRGVGGERDGMAEPLSPTSCLHSNRNAYPLFVDEMFHLHSSAVLA